MTTNALIHQEPETEYRKQAAERLTSHQLADFRRSPLLYWRKKVGAVPDEDRPAYVIGRATHVLALEGREEYGRRYAVGGPVNEKTGKPFGANTKAYAEWAAAQEKEVLTDEQADLVEKVGTAVGGHPLVRNLLAKGMAEAVARVDYCGRPCQIRMDWWNPDAGIVDLKTADDLQWFEADSKRYGYGYQMAFYRAVLGRVLGNLSDIPVHVIGVEKREPYRVGVWRMDKDVLSACQCENERAIDRLRDCERFGVWPTGFEDLRTLSYA